MKTRSQNRRIFLTHPSGWIVAACGLQLASADFSKDLHHAPAPVDNPLKGLVPYRGDVRARFPHSMEFSYLPYSALVNGYEEFDWRPLEEMLEEVCGRGHQAIFRIYLEYPGKDGGIPEFLIAEGLKITTWEYDGSGGKRVSTPDYANPHLRRSLRHFIAALGAKYDGDPRIGFITVGLLGVWGEWHNHPRAELFADKAVQAEVMDAYEAAFQATPLLLRYPAGDSDARFAKNCDRGFGYHDDSFAWATLATGKPEDQWFYQPALRLAGPAAEAKWQIRAIGGEIRPEAWGQVFDEQAADPRIQNFRQCVAATHVTWLLDSGMFGNEPNPTRVLRAEEEVRRMGYEFHATSVAVSGPQSGKRMVVMTIENRGVAPIYHPWKAEWGLLADGKVLKIFPGDQALTGLLPGGEPLEWKQSLELGGIRSGTATVAVRVPNPLKQGKPIRFANATQEQTHGWLLLGEIEIP
jgi:hypothetical protein